MPEKPVEAHSKLISSLHERAKELQCLYEVEELLNNSDQSLAVAFNAVVKVIASGMQYPDITRALITYEQCSFKSMEFEATPWGLCTEINVQGETVGTLCTYYAEDRPDEDEGAFLSEEVRLLKSIAERLGYFILFKRLKSLRATQEIAEGELKKPEMDGWRGTIQMLRVSDRALYLRIARKMLNYLCSIGVDEASSLLQDADIMSNLEEVSGELNVPGYRKSTKTDLLLSDRPFEIAADNLNSETFFDLMQKWMQEDKAAFFIKILANPRSSINEISDAIRRYRHIIRDSAGLPAPIIRGLRVNLIKRFLNEQLDFLKIAKNYIRIIDVEEMLSQMVLAPSSYGKLGGKSAGLILATRILQENSGPDCPIDEVRIPKTWYVISDGMLDFIADNNLEDVIEQKFRDVDEIRQDYPNIVQLFKSSSFPPDFIKGLSVALDDFGEVPLIVRSSSLLEDRLGTAFSGKYKSLFLANQGSKQKRLEAILDAIAEVYASTFGPDPLEYRHEHELLEFSEEMGILIQEVVGKQAGKYFLPAFAGVAFSNNEFRWSPRIKREDGIIRLVPGLGTRAVDRISDDYPILLVPGKPYLRANVALDEIIRYSPRMADVINLETETFETIELEELLRETGADYPGFNAVFSKEEEGILNRVSPLLTDFDKDHLIPTLEGQLADNKFLASMGNILKLLRETLNTPVDIEFAHDGEHFYLLQCRPQSSAAEDAAAPIPKDISKQDTIFCAKRFVSNGWMPDITHIVYVDPQRYDELRSRNEMMAVSRAVSRLNKLLPKRKFILMGPGRWGSRGDIKLGVSVTYAGINNTAMLIEIAKEKGGYVPDLSFGTHFFQDLVEARIRYLPLYPDNEDIDFNERFLLGKPNLLEEILPDSAELSDVLRVIDVPAATGGRVLRVLMNADLDEAIGYVGEPSTDVQQPVYTETSDHSPNVQYWQWRMQMSEHIAQRLDGEQLGVVALYVFGSTKNASAGPGSDIDLLIHFRGSRKQERDLKLWLDGWSQSLAEINYLRTGYKCKGLLDIHLVTDRDIANRTSFAIKIGAVTDAARELPLMSSVKPKSD
ncbi:MAG: pyruvate, phosphate dikinase [bacterium]|nr:pyruvate, phosphate dikinase [bacterium]